MPKRYSVTQESIRTYVDDAKERIGYSSEEAKAFEYIASQTVLGEYGIDDDETMRGLFGGGNDGGYDGAYLFVNQCLINGEDTRQLSLDSGSRVDIHLIQAKYQTSLSEVVLQNWKDSFSNLISSDEPDRQRYSNDVIEFFDLLKFVLSNALTKKLVVTITFWAVSLVENIHPNLEKQANELELLVRHKVPDRVSVSVKLLSASDLYSLLWKDPDETMKLKAAKEPLCPDEHSAILTVSLDDYYDFIIDANGELKKQLFEANIRDYQGKIEVNRAIYKTLENSGEVDFWWLNNGITILADSVSRDMGNAISMDNPRIVNGLQTSNEIWRYCSSPNHDCGSRKILVKCIASDNQETRSLIIQATNNQSRIPSAYLRSLEPIHLHIERYFKRNGLHYDRRKSSCKNAGIPSKDIISVPFFGQCLISTLLQQPDYARARPSQILSDDDKYKKIFDESISLDSYLALGKIAVYLRQRIKASGLLNSGAQNDLYFYVLMGFCIRQIGKVDIRPDDLKDLKAPDDSLVDDVLRKIKNEYELAGSSSTVVKNSAFVERVKGCLGFSGA